MPSLLILSLLHLVALSRPVSGDPLRSREEPFPSDPDIDTRTFFSIVSGCLATVFACTWVSVHPNVPGPNEGKLALAGRRLGLMLVGIIAPELMAGFAARQFLDARWFSKKYDMSITHGFFFAMGGFVSADDHPIVYEEQLGPEYLAAIRSIRVKDIEDKSKGDSLSKGVVVLQGLWFTAQCLARVQQHLPLTALEVATLAFQSVNIFIWLLWWHKPLDVQQPILLGPADASAAWAERRHGPWAPCLGLAVFPGSGLHGFLGKGRGRGKIHFVSKYIFMQSLVGTIFGVIHCGAWNAHFPSTNEKLIWRSFLGRHWTGKTHISVEITTFIISYIAAPLAYITARLLLIALSFASMRALPDRAFVDVNWSTYIPHL
ncbi:hypothetical protein DFH08DRAFT_1003089 [Mycena albidolilacea]|uniref:Wax synthase domain-containing protein n=1 Tax=Mycena albidolilacea TaxID=1033008 RepID=A0AAD7F4A6_9AGAR|nr:hypothetical protein DFH08DRAFT_1003089 [Mycena albidolilacea]